MVTGIVLADTFDIASWIYLFSALCLVPFLIVLYFKGRIYLTGILGLVCLAALSGFSYSFRFKTYPPGHIVHYVDDEQKYMIFGTVNDWPVIRNNRTSLIISVDSVAHQGRVKRGIGCLLLNLQTETTALSYGDRIYFESRLYSIKGGRNPAGLDYRRYLNLKNVFAVAYLPHQYNLQIDRVGPGHFYRVVRSVRNYITGTFRNTLDPDAAALASGFLIGETKDISRKIYDRFRDSGTLHLLAVSGSNVGLVIVLFVFLLKASPLTPVRRTILLLMVIIFFSFLAYNQPSVVRAAVMASLVLLGKALQRKIDLNNIIASAALIILVFKPTELFDIGFQLSFATAWGLIFFVPRVMKIFKHVRTKMYFKVLLFPLIICVVSQLVSLPLCAYYFQRLPVVAFVSNLVIVPLVSIIVLGELVLLLTNLILPLAGIFIGSLVNPFISLTLYLLELFGSGKLNVLLTARISGLPLILYYLFLVILSCSLFSKQARRLSILYLLLVANGFVILGAFAAKSEPSVTIFSVPGGIISVNRINRPQVVLINLPSKDYVITERIVEPFLAARQIRNPDIIALSGDYPTVREAVSLLKKNRLSNIYLPASSRFQFLDLCILDSINCDSATVSYYGGSMIPDGLHEYDAILLKRLLLYEFDSCTIVFAGNGGRAEQLAPLFETGGTKLVLVKPIITEEDLSFTGTVTGHSLQFIVCNRVTKKARQLILRREMVGESCPAILETSQVGAVELDIESGPVVPVS